MLHTITNTLNVRSVGRLEKSNLNPNTTTRLLLLKDGYGYTEVRDGVPRGLPTQKKAT